MYCNELIAWNLTLVEEYTIIWLLSSIHVTGKIRNYLELTHGIKVNFSGTHVNYYSAWRYTTKDDDQYIQSKNHPDLTNS